MFCNVCVYKDNVVKLLDLIYLYIYSTMLTSTFVALCDEGKEGTECTWPLAKGFWRGSYGPVW